MTIGSVTSAQRNRMAHKNKETDGFCPRCKEDGLPMRVYAFIPHEHDPSICPACNGTGVIDKTWRNRGVPCKRCNETGKVIFTNG